MFPVPLVTSSKGLIVPEFWKVVLLYHNRPFLINKLITATTKLLFCKIECSGSLNHISELFTPSAILYEKRKLKTITKETVTEDFIKNLVGYNKKCELTNIDQETFLKVSTGIYVSVQFLISRRNAGHLVLEVVILDKNTNSAIFVAPYETSEEILTPHFPYELHLDSGNFRINLQNFEDADTARAEWLADMLFPKLLKWSKSDGEEKNSITSLSLIPLDEYCIMYDRLKRTYVQELMKEWSNIAKTDPQKYIFEDIAIATYLICLWKAYPHGEINFVDCGCGNGLLVYILNQEGFSGFGIDIRKRSIWDIYPKGTKLEVGTVTPDSTFPNSTWLIGNHSDELTPWIPVIALRSSKKTNFFVLPCCAYDFNGEKYKRSNTSLSVYADYLLYIEDICRKCGFKTDIDKLRIPSTKKVCLVGINSSTDERFTKVLEDMKLLINSKMKTKFKPRKDTEPVRNCTQLKRALTDKLISLIVNLLLTEENLITKKDKQYWNKGTTYLISDVSNSIPREDLKELKLQCGGLQTLMKNFRFIFEVDKGTVCLRQPVTYEVTNERYRSKPCWFHKFHPQGCVNTAEDCGYFHG